MPTLTITPRDLATVIKKVLPFASSDTWSPALCAVQISHTGTHLTAGASNRYAVGVTKISHENAEPFEANIPAARCAEMLQFYKVPRGGNGEPITLAVVGSTISVSQHGHHISMAFESAGESPRLMHIFKGAREDAQAAPSFLTAEYLKLFSHLGQIAVYRADAKLTFVTADDFMGAVAGLHGSATEGMLARQLDYWPELFPVESDAA